MSPFEQVSDDLGEALEALDPRSQAVVFAGAAVALAGGYTRWADSLGLVAPGALFDQALAAVRRFAIGEVDDLDGELAARVEAAVPMDPEDSDGFAAAQGCWVCLDIAFRCALGTGDVTGSAWYLLDPMFQAVSERLFGYSDVGSDDEEEGEAAALLDPQLAVAVSAVRSVTADLRGFGPRTAAAFDQSARSLSVLAP